MKKFLSQFDMFTSTPLLRAHKQPQTSSYPSGLLSFILTLFFSYLFIINVKDVLSYSNIDSVETESRLDGKEVKAQNIFFGVRIGYLTVAKTKTLFDVGIYTQNENGENITVGLEACRSQQWSSIGEGYQDQFEDYSLGEFLCPINNQNLDISKVFYAPDSVFVSLYIRPCTSHPDCMPLLDQQLFLKQILQKQGAIFLLFYFLDNSIKPNERVAIAKTINTDTEMAFTLKRGIIGTIQMGTYLVETDEGFFPVQEIHTQNANFVHICAETSIQKSDSQNYAFIYITMNRRFVHIKRKVGKLDEMLSYAGGLFSIIISFLAFFMNSYNEYKYELIVAEGTFNEDHQEHSIKQNSFNLFKYIKYSLYDWINVLTCKKIGWKDCQMIDQARQQANTQLDVTTLFRRINNIDMVINMLMSEEERTVLNLLKPMFLEESKNKRKQLNYYFEVMGNDQAITPEDYRNSQDLLLKCLGRGNSRNHTGFEGIFGHGKNLNHEKVQNIIDKYPDIIQAARSLELSDQMKDTEQQLANLYMKLEASKRDALEEKIPIKILVRIYDIKKSQRDNINKFVNGSRALNKKSIKILDFESESCDSF